MNTLDRDIQKGEVVVVKNSVFSRKFETELEQRLFVCEDGFGMAQITMGQAIFGYWLKTGTKSRIEGTWIDKGATKRYQKEMSNG